MNDYSPLLQQGLKLVRQAADEDRAGMSREALKHYKLALEAFVAVIRTEKNQKIVSTVLPQVKIYMQRAEELQTELELEDLIDRAEPPPKTPVEPVQKQQEQQKKELAPPLTANGSPFPPSPSPAAIQQRRQQQQQQQQQQLPPGPEYSCLPTSLFSSDQVSKYAKPPTSVPASMVAATSAREREDKFFADLNKADIAMEQQQQQQQQQVKSSSISDFPAAPTTTTSAVTTAVAAGDDGGKSAELDETGAASLKETASAKSTNVQRYTLKISEGERHYGPETLFGSLVTGNTASVRVVDPAMRCARQLRVFLRFCEVVLSHSSSPVIFELRTQRDAPPSDQLEILQHISASLHAYNGSRLVVTFAETQITDRTVAFDNGAFVRCSRGIDVYHTQDVSPWSIGMCDFELCPCHAATFEYILPAALEAQS